MKFNESATVEQPIIRFLQDKLGYAYLSPEDFATLRSRENEVFAESELAQAIQRINGLTDQALTAAIIRELKKADTNQAFLELLRHGIELKNPETGKTAKYRVIDLDNPAINRFVITNQLYFAGETENIIPDIMLFVNGMPLVDIEAKSPTSHDDYAVAIGQLKRYERVAPRLYVPNLFNIATDGLRTVYGATYAPDQHFLTWRNEDLRQEYGDEGGLEVTLDGLLRPENLLDMLANFITYEETDEGAVKKIARYQQVRATNKVLARVREGDVSKGLIWHTQGSGKTLTMFFTAWKLRFDPTLASPKIFLLIDRIDLDDQAYGEFVRHGGKNVVRVTSRKQLEEVIRFSERGIFISTIQKFSELGDEIETLDRNVIVLSDEAHRSEEGVAGINLRSSLKNAFFFGYTGTPIDRKTLNTYRNYGPDGERYLDYYSIQQAVDDKATLPVTYEARLSKFAIDEARVDEQFEGLTVDLSDEQRQELVRRYGKKSALVKLPSRMKAVAQDIVEHFKAYVEPSGFKAQVVCYDREATAEYKRLLDGMLPAEWSAVVYSSGNPNTDTGELSRYNTTKKEREDIIRNFKDPRHPLRFVLVCDMLLTGFDAPIEQVMYLDKPLRDHSLLQAIARTNRVYEGKLAGKIIDYYGITRNLYDSLDFDESVVDEAMVSIDAFKHRFSEVHDQLVHLFEGVNREDPSAENLRFVLRRFIDNEEKQNFFSDRFSRVKSLFEFLAPDPFLKPYVRILEWLGGVYAAFLKEFRNADDTHVLRGFGEKLKGLINENVQYEGITRNFRVMEVQEIYAAQHMGDMDEREKALQLEKLLKSEISEHLETNPQFQKFSERLRMIRDQFEQGQLDLSGRMNEYRKLIDNVRTAAQEANESGMDMRTYGLYLRIKEFAGSSSDEDVRAFASELTDVLQDRVLDRDWQASSKYDLFVKNIKRTILELTLKTYKDRVVVDDFAKFQNRLTDAIIKAFR